MSIDFLKKIFYKFITILITDRRAFDMDKRNILSISLDRDLSDLIRREAFVNDMTISQYVRDILYFFIQNKDHLNFYKKNKFELMNGPNLTLWETIKGLFTGEIIFLRKRRDTF